MTSAAPKSRGEEENGSEAPSALNASSERQHCAVLASGWLLQEGGRFRSRQGSWVLTPAATHLTCHQSFILRLLLSCLSMLSVALQNCFVADRRIL